MWLLTHAGIHDKTMPVKEAKGTRLSYKVNVMADDSISTYSTGLFLSEFSGFSTRKCNVVMWSEKRMII